MPHKWSNTPSRHQATLWPHRSLPRRGFAAIILLAFTLITIPLYGLLGTVFLWGLLPFLMAAVAGLWWALEHTYKTAEVLEVLAITPQTTTLIHQPRKGEILIWDCNTYWVRVEIHSSGGPVPHYITLTGNNRTVEIGSFLSEEERCRLILEIEKSLGEMKTP
ncbi:DUF2244 domain-containing protein [Alisedimentitalea sp. MJ-SS2]|uniref:DUF2244 domain-containing protein n=1 Tax=Aliisedimentitalea sp. MJ-SS2 TaxID=3049795 RepID=UPI002910D5E2|nr:DUF2244 domain-containing protein [Alisedimentitalea sp. MJ-SS2]MDU8927465.1 DUF2244 domain-containing protein [Alisedimentitalea sp. MJ-SS2]